MSKPEKLDLIRDVLDKLLVDRDKVPLGRVDGIVLLLKGEEGQPRVVQIECGMVTLLRRLSIKWADRAYRISRCLGLRRPRPIRLDWSKIDDIGREVTLRSLAKRSPLLAGEYWLRDHVIRHIPWNGMEKE